MKKVLSVLLAAAMVMGMSVSAFAAAEDTWTWTGVTADTNLNASDITLKDEVIIVRGGEVVDTQASGELEGLQPGDDLYFPMQVVHEHTAECCTNTKEKHDHATALNVNCTFDHEDGPVSYKGSIDEDWSIKSKKDSNVSSITFATVKDNGDFTTSLSTYKNNAKYIKVALVDDLDSVDEVEVDFYAYIKDKKTTSNKVVFDSVVMENDAVKLTAADAEDFVTIGKVKQVLADVKVKDVTLEIIEDEVYFTVTMIDDEEVVINLSTSYSKAIDALFDYDADLNFYNFKGSNDAFAKVGELFIATEENYDTDETYIYEVVDGELVEVEAEWVEEYEVNGVDLGAGWVIKTSELGYYVVSDTEAEIVVAEETETTVEAETEKANPETGAADFVGAAVALAVVSVAAAGALALKK